MKHGPTIFVFLAASLSGCTRHNGLYLSDNGDSGSGGHQDLSVKSRDLGGVDLSTGGDDLSAVAGMDLSTGDGASACSDATCICCVGGQCLSMGASCGTDEVCTARGCRSCGGPEEPCCAGAVCNAGGCCGGDACIASGRSCAAATSAATKVCLAGACQECGAHGQPCCADEACAPATVGALGVCCDVTTRTCVADSVPTADVCGTTTCGLNGSCGGCGGTGSDTCCPTSADHPSLCSASKTTCVLDNNGGGASDSCQACGGNNQPCCDGNACDSGGCCVQDKCVNNNASCGQGLGNCKTGSCGTCGGLGQACCAGDACTATDTRCLLNICAPCGGQDQRCCFDPSDGVNDFCERPYNPVFMDPQTCFCRT